MPEQYGINIILDRPNITELQYDIDNYEINPESLKFSNTTLKQAKSTHSSINEVNPDFHIDFNNLQHNTIDGKIKYHHNATTQFDVHENIENYKKKINQLLLSSSDTSNYTLKFPSSIDWKPLYFYKPFFAVNRETKLYYDHFNKFYTNSLERKTIIINNKEYNTNYYTKSIRFNKNITINSCNIHTSLQTSNKLQNQQIISFGKKKQLLYFTCYHNIVLKSTDGIMWIKQYEFPTNTYKNINCISIEWNGKVLVVVGKKFDTTSSTMRAFSPLQYSKDNGESWFPCKLYNSSKQMTELTYTYNPLISKIEFKDIIWDGNKFIAMEVEEKSPSIFYTYLYVSYNGEIWEKLNTPVSTTINSVSIGWNSTVYMVVGNEHNDSSINNKVFYSYDLINWYNKIIDNNINDNSSQIYQVVCNENITIFCLNVLNESRSFLLYFKNENDTDYCKLTFQYGNSYDSYGLFPIINKIIWNGNIFVASVNNDNYISNYNTYINIIYSYNGIEWYFANVYVLNQIHKILSFVWNGEKFFAYGYNDGQQNSDNITIWSNDGINWNIINEPYLSNEHHLDCTKFHNFHNIITTNEYANKLIFDTPKLLLLGNKTQNAINTQYVGYLKYTNIVSESFFNSPNNSLDLNTIIEKNLTNPIYHNVSKIKAIATNGNIFIGIRDCEENTKILYHDILTPSTFIIKNDYKNNISYLNNIFFLTWSKYNIHDYYLLYFHTYTILDKSMTIKYNKFNINTFQNDENDIIENYTYDINNNNLDNIVFKSNKFSTKIMYTFVAIGDSNMSQRILYLYDINTQKQKQISLNNIYEKNPNIIYRCFVDNPNQDTTSLFVILQRNKILLVYNIYFDDLKNNPKIIELNELPELNKTLYTIKSIYINPAYNKNHYLITTQTISDTQNIKLFLYRYYDLLDYSNHIHLKTLSIENVANFVNFKIHWSNDGNIIYYSYFEYINDKYNFIIKGYDIIKDVEFKLKLSDNTFTNIIHNTLDTNNDGTILIYSLNSTLFIYSVHVLSNDNLFQMPQYNNCVSTLLQKINFFKVYDTESNILFPNNIINISLKPNTTLCAVMYYEYPTNETDVLPNDINLKIELVDLNTNILFSNDGLYWDILYNHVHISKYQTTNAFLPLHVCNDIIWTGDMFVAVGNSMIIYTSYDGFSWENKYGLLDFPMSEKIVDSLPLSYISKILWCESKSQFIVFGKNITLTNEKIVYELSKYIINNNTCSIWFFNINKSKLEFVQAKQEINKKKNINIDTVYSISYMPITTLPNTDHVIVILGFTSITSKLSIYHSTNYGETWSEYEGYFKHNDYENSTSFINTNTFPHTNVNIINNGKVFFIPTLEKISNLIHIISWTSENNGKTWISNNSIIRIPVAFDVSVTVLDTLWNGEYFLIFIKIRFSTSTFLRLEYSPNGKENTWKNLYNTSFSSNNQHIQFNKLFHIGNLDKIIMNDPDIKGSSNTDLEFCVDQPMFKTKDPNHQFTIHVDC